MYGILNHNTTDDKLVSIQKEKVVFIQLIYLSLRLVVSRSLLLYLVLIRLPGKPMGAVSAFTDRNLSLPTGLVFCVSCFECDRSVLCRLFIKMLYDVILFSLLTSMLLSNQSFIQEFQ